MLKQFKEIMISAGRLMTNVQDAAVHRKEGHFNFVTDMDLKVQEYLRGQLLSLLPGSTLFAEEQENQQLSDQPTWVVDPIDGTVNYMRGRRCSSVSVALLKNRKPQLAAVYDPYSGELFTAQAGAGCQCNDMPVHVSDMPFERALVTFGTSPYEPDLAKQGMQAAYALLLAAGDLRRSGSAAIDLAWVACGRSELFFEMMLAPWDYAAGALLVQEAGGHILQPLNDAFDFGQSACILASNPHCLDGALSIIRQVANGQLEV